MINGLYSSMKVDGVTTVSPGKVEQIFNKFREHFVHEEEFMLSNGYQGLEAHKAEHEEFLARFGELKQEVSARNQGECLKVLGVLTNWWEKHHNGEDAKLAEFSRRLGKLKQTA